MKVIILAGGWGTRLGKQTDFIPKPMVRIGSKPILWHIMKIYSHFRFNEFVICLGVKGEVIKEYFYNWGANNNDFTVDIDTSNVTYHSTKNGNIDWKVTLVDTGLNTLKGGRIKRIEQYLDDEINMLTYGDGVANVDVRKLLDFHKDHKKMVTITGVHPPSRFGEIITKGNKVVSFQEKPQTSSGLINGGFMVFNRGMLKYLTKEEKCDFEFGPLEILAQQGEIMVYRHEGMWECMDNERDLNHLTKLWNGGDAFWKMWK